MNSNAEIKEFVTRYGEAAVINQLSETAILSAAARIAVSRRKTNRPKVYRPCPVCGREDLGFRELQVHLPECRKAKREELERELNQ